MSRIFISYKRVDKDKVFKIKDQIESALGEKCWIDLDGIESDAQFKNVIINAINECEIVLFMYSKAHSKIVNFEKDWTVRELNFAFQKNKRIVFINIDGSILIDEFSFDYGTKQQVDATSEDALSRLFLDLEHWLFPNRESEREQRHRAEEMAIQRETDELRQRRIREEAEKRVEEELRMRSRNDQAKDKWEQIKNTKDLFVIAKYREEYKDSPYIREADNNFYKLRSILLTNMKYDPSAYSVDEVERYIDAGIFTINQLRRENLLTNDSWKAAHAYYTHFDFGRRERLESNKMPSEKCTDVFFLGLPCSGKSCILAGLVRQHKLLDYGTSSKLSCMFFGSYKHYLDACACNNSLPVMTPPDAIFPNNGEILLRDTGKILRRHFIRLIEMSGQIFEDNFAAGKPKTFLDMDDAFAKHFCSKNRKILYLVINTYQSFTSDARFDSLHQEQLLKFKELIYTFQHPANKEIMKKVDAIHLIITKEVLPKDYQLRKLNVQKLLQEKYGELIESIREYCKKTKKINRSFDYSPQILIYTPGKFYLGRVCDYNHEDNTSCDIIRSIFDSIPTSSNSFFDKLRGLIKKIN